MKSIKLEQIKKFFDSEELKNKYIEELKKEYSYVRLLYNFDNSCIFEVSKDIVNNEELKHEYAFYLEELKNDIEKFKIKLYNNNDIICHDSMIDDLKEAILNFNRLTNYKLN